LVYSVFISFILCLFSLGLHFAFAHFFSTVAEFTT